jgi:hypothetical protein
LKRLVGGAGNKVCGLDGIYFNFIKIQNARHCLAFAIIASSHPIARGICGMELFSFNNFI